LILAGAFHVALTLGIFLVGHFQLLPNLFDTNGVGISFAIDSSTYRYLGSRMADEFEAKGLSPWLAIKAPLHCRLYSLSFLLLGRLLGHNILGAELLNLFYYLGILTVVYLLGREIFNPRAGLLAAAIVGLWPSFLLHSTQLLRDPLSILCFLALLLILTMLLTREFSWRRAIAMGTGGAILVTVFWLARGNMWNAVVVAVVITVLMLAYRMIREAKLMPGNALVMLLIIAATLLVPSRLESTTLSGVRPPTTPLAIPSASQPAPRSGFLTEAINQIRNRRAGFRFYRASASNIDSDVQFAGAADVLKFIPRAALIGFFAPFPKMWVQTGTFGVAGRLLSGFETLAMYLLYVAVAVCLWNERRRLTMWLMFSVATVGLIGLGLAVVNAGALYRIRYVFWIMLIVIAAQSVLTMGHFRRKKAQNTQNEKWQLIYDQ
jgi:4-amino-4-deoxy-L-arabinose transferase-like glycosyltransferase